MLTISNVEKTLLAGGIKRLTLPLSGGGSVSQSSLGESVAMISTVGPYNRDLLNDPAFAGEKMMIDGYLDLHANFLKVGIPNILMVRDLFASSLPISDGSYLAEAAVSRLVAGIEEY